jgi:hypothetical protein
MKDEVEKLYIDCDCHSEVMGIEKWGDEWGLFWITIYKSDKLGFFQRIKFAWKYLVYGEFYGNDMTIRKEDLNRFIEFLQKAQNA